MAVSSFIRGLLPPIVGRIRKTRAGWLSWRVRRSAIFTEEARPHDLPAELLVSLTSYPARFETLDLTLRSLINQTVKPDRILLWIAHGDLAQIPARVRALESFGISITGCEDLRSYKKLIPALEAHPGAYIVTADDDVYYPPDWLETLVKNVDPAAPAILCHRAHRVPVSAGGELAPYLDWEFDVQDQRARKPSTDIVATGAGGVLYPPDCLDPRVSDRELFQRLCPDGDDLWFYWCARMAGTPYRKVGSRMRLITWPDSQSTALWVSNECGGNDRMIRALEAEFGAAPRKRKLGLACE